MKQFFIILLVLGFAFSAQAQTKPASKEYNVPTIAEVQVMANNMGQQIALQYPASQRPVALAILKKNYSPAFIQQVYKAGVTDYFTTHEIQRIENEPGYAETPAMKNKIQQSLRKMYGMQMQPMFQVYADLMEAGLQPPTLQNLIDLQELAK